MNRSVVYLLAAVILVASGFFATTEAQLGLPGLASPVLLEIEPAVPNPGESVVVRAESFSIDLNRALVSWYINGALRLEGAGETETMVTVGPVGSETTILVVVNDGEASAERTIRPTEVSILWEADSYTPPFYRGRALPSPGTPLNVEAVVRFVRRDGTVVPPEDIVYTWSVNGRVQGQHSGRGKSRVRLAGPELLGDRTILLEAVSADSAFSGVAYAFVPVRDPYPVLYHDHPLTGITYHQALSSEDTLSDSEVTVAAVPYYADAAVARDNALQYEWTVNNVPIDADPIDPNRLILSIGEADQGLAEVALSLVHTRHVLQFADRVWHLELSSLNAAGGTDPFSRRTTAE